MICPTVSFDDCSTLRVPDKGDAKFKIKTAFVETILDVLCVPHLKSNLSSMD